MIKMHLLVGNVGTGKSTLARKLAYHTNGCVFSMDDYQQMLSAGVYGNYDFHKDEIYKSCEDVTIKAVIENGFDIIIDRTNMDKRKRSRFIKIAQNFNLPVIVYDFGAGSDQTLLNRLKNLRGVSAETWTQVHNKFYDKYEEPTYDEGIYSIVKMNPKYVFHAFDFDGTIVENAFPAIGAIKQDTIKMMDDIYKDYNNIIMIWTCRTYNNEAQATEFLIKNKIPFDAINKNPIDDESNRKLFAHYYYDDRAITIK